MIPEDKYEVESPSPRFSQPEPSPSNDQQQQRHSSASSRNNQETQAHYSQNRRLIFWFYLLLTLAFVVSEVSLISLIWKNMQDFTNSDNFYFANQVSYQWQQGYITDITINTNACPDGYQPAINYQWSGTSFGCFCSPNVNSSFVLQGYCSPKLIQSSCRNIPSQDPITARNWYNGSLICVKRSTVSFKTQQKYNGNNKICGSSRSLTIMPNNQNCPLVNASFTLPTLQAHFYAFTDSSLKLPTFYGTFNATSPYSFYSYPISKFTVSEYDFCLIDEDQGVSPTHIDFLLLKYTRGCSTQGNYQTLDSISQIDFYAANPQLNSLQNVDGFPKPGNWKYNLGFSSLPSWTYNCRHNYDQKFAIVKALVLVNFQFFKSYYYVALVKVLFLCVIGFTVFILAVRRIFKREVYPVGYKQMHLPKDFTLAIIRYVIDLVSKLTILGLLIYSTWVIFANWNWFKSALNLSCPDNHPELITYVMQPYRDMYQRSMMLSVGQITIFLFVFIVDIVHFVYIYRNQLSFYLVSSYGKALVKEDDDLDWIQKDKEAKKMEQEQENNKQEVQSDKFRITMAINMMDMDRSIQDGPVRSKIMKKKKKKKTFGAFLKSSLENNQINEEEFNPYSLQDPSMIALGSVEQINGRKPDEQQQQNDVSRGKKMLRRKKK